MMKDEFSVKPMKVSLHHFRTGIPDFYLLPTGGCARQEFSPTDTIAQNLTRPIDFLRITEHAPRSSFIHPLSFIIHPCLL